MSYRLLADVVVVLHFAYVAFVVLAMAAILLGIVFRWQWVRNFWFRAIHFLMIAVVAVQSVLSILCPLTTLEDFLRGRAGESVRSGSFVGRWAHELLFVEAPPWAFTTIYCLFAAAVLATLILAPPRWPWAK
jgi:MFS superfamily sulfate permease-like transporter